MTVQNAGRDDRHLSGPELCSTHRWALVTAVALSVLGCSDLDLGDPPAEQDGSMPDATGTASGGSGSSGASTLSMGDTTADAGGAQGDNGETGSDESSDAGQVSSNNPSRDDRTMASTDAAVADPCDAEGALRCSTGTSTARLRCSDAAWESAEPCAEGQACVPEAEASCELVFEACLGHEGDFICDNSTLHECGSYATSLSKSDCESALHCTQGASVGHCRSCLDGEYRCENARLLQCAEDEFSLKEECASEALCNATAGACTDQVCTPNQVVCEGDVSRQCNAEGSALDAGKPCPNGCNRETGQCYSCVPDALHCDEDGTTRVACNAEGTMETTTACPARCVNGECVECAASSAADDCEVSAECRVPSCVAGQCAESVQRTGRCDGDSYCDFWGECVECLSDDHCPGDLNTCPAGSCESSCGNGTIDYALNEWCDPAEPGVKTSRELCDTESCRVTDNFYSACSLGQRPFPGEGVFDFAVCGAHGAVTVGCPDGPDVCRASSGDAQNATCEAFPGQRDGRSESVSLCMIPCRGNRSNCPNSLDCVNVEVGGVRGTYCGTTEVMLPYVDLNQ